MSRIYGERIKQAREYHGLTQKELAEAAGVLQPAIAKMEMDATSPSDNVLNAIVQRTGFPPAFFLHSADEDFPAGSLLYRAKESLTVRDRARAYRAAQLIRECVESLARRVRAIPIRVPELKCDPASAARITRSTLGLTSDEPIAHLINAVERIGVLVLVLPFAVDKLDAFSSWPPGEGQRPMIAITEGVPGDRLRYSVGHELGHLVLHATPSGTIAGMEKQADAFASELLLPESAMRQELLVPVTLSSVAQLKVRWRVSMQALIMRARSLGIITERQHKYLFKQLTIRGWRKREPENLDVPVEKPRAPRKMAEIVYGGASFDLQRVAGDLKQGRWFIESMMRPYLEQADLPARSKPVTQSELDGSTVIPFVRRADKRRSWA